MARKGATQLQQELATDEEFDLFIQLPGLLVIDVYSEWCGPCTGMVGTLRRVKLEIGGDNLLYATAKSDSISYLQRFCKKSEPTWLFLTERRVVNLLFGSDSPKLVKMIIDELKVVGKLANREHFDITEPLPEEQKRDRIKNEAKDAKILKETKERERKKREYFTYVTDTIIENLPDVGITVFGPQVGRDLLRKLMEIGAETFHIQCKDRRVQPITKEEFEIINTASKNPLSNDILEALDGKELSICFWKAPNEKTKIELLQAYAEELTKQHTVPPDEYQDHEEIVPPLIAPAYVKIEFEIPDDQECPVDVDREPSPPKPRKQSVHEVVHEEVPEVIVADEDHVSELGSEEGADETVNDQTQPTMPDLDIGLDSGSIVNTDIEEEEISIVEIPKKNICIKTVKIPPVWVPRDMRTHAALIYVLFRAQTQPFLPPDPVPDPPHIVMAFDTYKNRDLIDFAERNKEDIPLYGFFTSDEAEETQFIASSKQVYAKQPASATDKIVFKVNKRTSHTMLSMATYGPTYVSPNTTIGEEEAKIFFPENYVSAEVELLEERRKEDLEMKTKAKQKELKKEESSEALRRAEMAAKAEMEALKAAQAEAEAAAAADARAAAADAADAEAENVAAGAPTETQDQAEEAPTVGENAEISPESAPAAEPEVAAEAPPKQEEADAAPPAEVPQETPEAPPQEETPPPPPPPPAEPAAEEIPA